ncbi:cellulose synthase operon protein YhjQ [Spongiibacter sp. KMU-158]|uniref:Cellulose synthase operon protein YhjQ n=1 Tax=Spongiibacter pelagi TaxID=2760804 RepID=A0A927C120_9GAMM|nr:cellulose biosynthesis protein BcsQ [Spongiibacter pelagi]MBD2857681.1 cellulose synthase operon protein YhjQ [Spongiibacter pelagi]
MKTLLFSGCRGGVGNSSVTANLAATLQKNGHQTLTLDLNDSNTTSLYFGIDPRSSRGWGQALLDGHDFSNAAFQSNDGRWMLPYGSLKLEERYRLNAILSSKPELLSKTLAKLKGVDFLIIDCPTISTQKWAWAEYQYLKELFTLNARLITTLTPSAPDYSLLKNHPDWRDYSALLLLNMQRPESQLHHDLRLVIQTEFHEQILPIALSQDITVAEACAHLQTVVSYAPASQASKEFLALAHCCENLWRVAK